VLSGRSRFKRNYIHAFAALKLFVISLLKVVLLCCVCARAEVK